MNTSQRNARRQRRLQVESLEPRLMMAADSQGELKLDYLSGLPGDEVRATLADAHALTGWATARTQYGFSGVGQTVAVIDSGIAYDHTSLGGGFGVGSRVVGGWDFTEENDANPYDDGPAGSHGTHVAGIVGSSHTVHSGVAPGVDLVALRVFNDAGSGYFNWVEQALQWTYANRDAFRYPITTVNLSIGSTWNSTTVPSWSTLEDEFAQLKSAGMFISVAAGNSFTQYNVPGLSYPAASSYVVPVMSVDDNGQMSSFSQRHGRAIAAPGRTITSTVPDYRGNLNGRADDFLSYSGTSMAAPYVAGASVVLRQALQFAGHTQIDQDLIYSWMRNTADTVYDAVTGQDYLRLNLGRALAGIMPADDFASTTAQAHSLGTAISTLAVSGRINSLDDKDYFRFTAGRTGRVTITAQASAGMSPVWELAGAGLSGQGASFSFDVAAGQSYTFGVATASGLGSYQLNLNLAPANAGWGPGEIVVAAPMAGDPPLVQVFDARSGALLSSFHAYDPAFRLGVRVAVGDVNGDGVKDVITAPGAGGGPHVKVFDGATGELMAGPLGSFYAYSPSFGGGVFVAAGDVNGDGRADVITGADAGGSPHVRVFCGATGQVLASFLAYGSGFSGGVRVAAGDIDGDGRADIVTAPGAGGGPHVRVFSGTSGQPLAGPLASFFAYSPTYSGGVYVTAGDFDGDGRAEVATGSAVGAGHVVVFGGSTGAAVRALYAFPGSSGGVRLGTADVNGDGRPELLLAPGSNGSGALRAVDGLSGAERAGFTLGGGLSGGLFVAGMPGPGEAIGGAFTESPGHQAALAAWEPAARLSGLGSLPGAGVESLGDSSDLLPAGDRGAALRTRFEAWDAYLDQLERLLETELERDPDEASGSLARALSTAPDALGWEEALEQEIEAW